MIELRTTHRGRRVCAARVEEESRFLAEGKEATISQPAGIPASEREMEADTQTCRHLDHES
jgi:hypothetical protein